jgi:hypothetical protein
MSTSECSRYPSKNFSAGFFPDSDVADERGSLDKPEDEAEIARYMRLLGGVTGPSELQAG